MNNIPKSKKDAALKVIHKPLYNLLRTKAGRPYKVAVQVLSEVIFYYSRNKVGKYGWNVCYRYFYEDLRHSHMTIYRALIYLSEMGLITKHIRAYSSQRSYCAN